MTQFLRQIQGIDPSTIFYVDEMGIDTFVYREYAYSKRGNKAIGFVSGKKYRRVGLVAAKSASGIVSPLQYDGSMDSILFEHWFELCLIPALPSNATIVLDNASFHRKSKLPFIAQMYGHRIIYLPPYSPELNPIENFWAWLKGKLKKILYNYDDFDEALRCCFNII